MQKIDVESNWGYWDRLGGHRLKNNEKLLIEFPDGHQETHRIVVNTSYDYVSDMGHESQIEVQRAYIKTLCHLVQVLVPIQGLLAKRLPEPHGQQEGDVLIHVTGTNAIE